MVRQPITRWLDGCSDATAAGIHASHRKVVHRLQTDGQAAQAQFGLLNGAGGR